MRSAGGRPACAQISDVQRWLRSAGAGPLAQEVSECVQLSSSRHKSGGAGRACRNQQQVHTAAASRHPSLTACSQSRTRSRCMHLQRHILIAQRLTASRHSRGKSRLSTAPWSSLVGRPTTGFSNHSRCRVPLRQARGRDAAVKLSHHSCTAVRSAAMHIWPAAVAPEQALSWHPVPLVLASASLRPTPRTSACSRPRCRPCSLSRGACPPPGSSRRSPHGAARAQAPQHK